MCHKQTQQEEEEEEDEDCLRSAVRGHSMSMFGLAQKLNSTLYWMTQRLRVERARPVREGGRLCDLY